MPAVSSRSAQWLCMQYAGSLEQVNDNLVQSDLKCRISRASNFRACGEYEQNLAKQKQRPTCASRRAAANEGGLVVPQCHVPVQKSAAREAMATHNPCRDRQERDTPKASGPPCPLAASLFRHSQGNFAGKQSECCRG